MITMQQLTYFVALAEILHYTRTSERLHITQPSLSYSINKMEKDLGVPLFMKKGKKLHLTQYGNILLPYAKQALETLDFGVKKIEALRNPEQTTINLGYIYSVSFDFFPSLISNFMNLKGNRQITFQLSQGIKVDLVQKLSEGQIDIAIAGDYDEPFLQKVQLFEQELFLLVPSDNPLSSRKNITLKELQHEDFIFPKHTSGLREILDKHFSQVGIIPHIILEAEECNAMTAFVNMGVGLAFIPYLPTLRTYKVSVLHVTEPPMRRNISLLWMRGRALSPLAERFKEFALQHGQDIQRNNSSLFVKNGTI